MSRNLVNAIVCGVIVAGATTVAVFIVQAPPQSVYGYAGNYVIAAIIMAVAAWGCVHVTQLFQSEDVDDVPEQPYRDLYAQLIDGRLSGQIPTSDATALIVAIRDGRPAATGTTEDP